MRTFDLASCAKLFQTETDNQGRFRFFQETGYPECTVCPCIQGVPSACDPKWFIYFEVKTKTESVFVAASQMGHGLLRAEFECDMEKRKLPPIIRNAIQMREMVCFPRTFVESLKSRSEFR